MRKPIKIIEGLCYLYPHIEELSATHPSMKALWRGCIKSLKEKDTILAPLLVDDINRAGFKYRQTVDEILQTAVGRSFTSLRWLGPQIIESKFELQYGNLGCKAFDSLYHKDVIFNLSLLTDEWEWHFYHPSFLKQQQSGMLKILWSLISEDISFQSLANMQRESTDVIRKELRDTFLNRFRHYWYNASGELESITTPIWSGGHIIHKPYEKL